MRANIDGADLRRPARVSSVICAVAAVVVAAIFALVGRPVMGLALAVGLLLGSLNGFIVGRLIVLPVPFVATSLLRLVTFSIIGAVIGLAFGLAYIWLVILGLGIAQLTLAAAAFREVARR